MDVIRYVQNSIPQANSPEKIYELFRSLAYPKDKLLDPSYKRKIDEFDFAKDEREKVKDIYTVFNYDGKLQIFLIETKSLSVPLVRYLTKRLSDRYLRFLLILTADYKEFSFVFPEFESIEEGKHKLKLTRLNFDRENPLTTQTCLPSQTLPLQERKKTGEISGGDGKTPLAWRKLQTNFLRIIKTPSSS